jgi:hypothetical protein
VGNVVSGGAVSWQSSNAAVATVSTSGLVTAVAPGEATVTASSNGKSGSATVFVLAFDHLVVSPTTASIPSASTQAFTATVYDANDNVVATQTPTWASSNTSVATVNGSGVATGVAAGLATISATAEGTTGSATLAVTTAASCKLIEGERRMSTSPLAKPGYLQSVLDPDFGTTITRISGDPGTPIGNGISGNWPTVVYHNYPKDPVFTADQKLLVLKHMSGVPTAGAALFLDGSTYQPLFARGGPSGGGEWRLHPTLPDIAVYLNSSGAVGHWNVRTNTSTVKVAAVSGYSSNELGPSEGNLSRDGRYLAAKAVRSSDSHLVARVIDIDGGTTGAVIDLTAANIGKLDWVSISAGGNYVVAYGTIDGTGQRTKVWRRDGTAVGYWTDYILGHYDLGFDQAGNEVAFGAVASGSAAKHYIARRLDTGAVTDLTGSAVTSYNWHAGARGPAGWGYASTNDNSGALAGEIYAFKLDGSGTVQRYAHHRTNNIDYDSAPFPTAAPDGKRVVFASNWGSSTGRPVQAYVVDVRPICP